LELVSKPQVLKIIFEVSGPESTFCISNGFSSCFFNQWH
jgi:hypothetical protein